MRRLALIAALIASTARGDFVVKQGGAHVGTARDVNCGTNMTCSVSGVTMSLSASGSGGSGGSGAPVDAGYVVLSGHSSGSTNERTLSAGNYTSIDTGTAGQVQVDWAHGLTCSSGQALVSSGTSAMQCTSTLTASDVACAGTCVSSAEIVSVTGAQVSSAVATATALAADPTACTSPKVVTDIAADGTLTCDDVAYANVTGTPTLYNQTVQDEGGNLTQRGTLNFAGAGVTCADDTTKTTCTIAGGSGGISFAEAAAANLAGAF